MQFEKFRYGPAVVTVGSITHHLRATIGSFYQRFASREALLAEVANNPSRAYRCAKAPEIPRL